MQRQHTAQQTEIFSPQIIPSEGKNGTSIYSFSLHCVFTSLLTIDFLHDHRKKHLGPDMQKYPGSWDKNQLDLDT